VINLRTSSGIVICDVAEHDGDWASAIANYGTDRPTAQVVLRCELQPVLATPREAAEFTCHCTSQEASCCSVDEGKREMKTLLNNFLTDFKRAYSDTFMDELNVYEGLGTRSPATVVPDLPRRSESASESRARLFLTGPKRVLFTRISGVIAVERYVVGLPPGRRPTTNRHLFKHIRGVRYKCNECADYDLVSNLLRLTL
jgi:hypothetical protein